MIAKSDIYLGNLFRKMKRLKVVPAWIRKLTWRLCSILSDMLQYVKINTRKGDWARDKKEGRR